MLIVENLDAFYGKKQVLFNVSFNFEDRVLGAVIGPNGAGKSTVLRAVFGMVPECRGRIEFDGRDMTQGTPLQSIQAGIAFVPQGARVFRDLTVGENLRMGGFTLPNRELRLRTQEVLEAFPILAQRTSQKAGALSGGERQMLAFGMALMLRPKLLMIDEPSIGLAPMMVTQVFDTIVSIRNKLGTAVLIVEQQAQQVLRIVDSVYVIRAGNLISQGPVENYRDPDVLRQVYLRESVQQSTTQEQSK
jgi:branched-chain amino acid transport system ATP-binding protein